MPAKISHIVQSQNFETVRDAIGSILALELANQYLLVAPANPLYLAKVWGERFIPFDKTELPAINVYFNNVAYDSKERHSTIGINKYVIEVILAAKNSATVGGDATASKNLQKLLGLIRYILENPNYTTLALPLGYIMGTEIESIRVIEPRMQGDATHTVAGQITFAVRMTEDNGTQTGILLEAAGTIAEIGETGNGLFYYVPAPLAGSFAVVLTLPATATVGEAFNASITLYRTDINPDASGAYSIFLKWDGRIQNFSGDLAVGGSVDLVWPVSFETVGTKTVEVVGSAGDVGTVSIIESMYTILDTYNNTITDTYGNLITDTYYAN